MSLSRPIRINILSLDFDGCIFNSKYKNSESANRLIEANEDFLNTVAVNFKKENVDEVVFIVGSSRQSHAIDKLNSKNKGSCFSALIELRSNFASRLPNIHCRVDKYLLADTYGNTSLGENFDNALQWLRNPLHDYDFSRWAFDESKLTILYAQMHKAASENPNAAITFDFYDDRYDGTNKKDDILKGLHIFFSKNSDLMPNNMILRLHHYDGAAITDISKPIKGTGEIDFNYHDNIRFMSDIPDYDDPLRGKHNLLKDLTKDEEYGLNYFKADRQLQPKSQITMNYQPIVTSSSSIMTTNTPITAPKRFSLFRLFCCCFTKEKSPDDQVSSPLLRQPHSRT